jgi:hypothetical protein
MTRDSRTERYASVDDILEDIDKLEGMDDLLDKQTQVLVGENPIATIKFREGAEEPMGEPLVEGEDGDKKPAGGGAGTHRPYSFQQRKKRP